MQINGKLYDWSSIDLKIPGLVIGIQSIDYDDELEKELVYGLGNKPRGFGTGNYKASAKMTLLKEDFDEIIAYCKKKKISLYELQFPAIVVSYANSNQRIVSDTLKQVSIAKTSNKAAQGDKGLKVDVDLFVAGLIERNGVQPI